MFKNTFQQLPQPTTSFAITYIFDRWEMRNTLKIQKNNIRQTSMEITIFIYVAQDLHNICFFNTVKVKSRPNQLLPQKKSIKTIGCFKCEIKECVFEKNMLQQRTVETVLRLLRLCLSAFNIQKQT